MNRCKYQRSRSFIDLDPRSLRLNTFKLFLRNRWSKFHVEPPWDGGTKSCSNDPGHMTNMAAMPIYGKNLKNLLLWKHKADDFESWYAALGTQVLPSLFKC